MLAFSQVIDRTSTGIAVVDSSIGDTGSVVNTIDHVGGKAVVSAEPAVGAGLVKGTNFNDQRYLGEPINAVSCSYLEYANPQEADTSLRTIATSKTL